MRIVYLTSRDKFCRQIIVIEIKRSVVEYSKLCCGMNHRVAYLLHPTKIKTKTELRDTNNITNGVTYGSIRWEVSGNKGLKTNFRVIVKNDIAPLLASSNLNRTQECSSFSLEKGALSMQFSPNLHNLTVVKF